MADHYAVARDLVDEVEQISDQLAVAYAENAERTTIGRLHHDLGTALKLASIHADLAIAQRLDDFGIRDLVVTRDHGALSL